MAAMICTLSINAQQINIDSLNTRIQVLERDFAYEQINGDIKDLTHDLDIKALQISTDNNTMTIQIFNKIADVDLYISNKTKFESYQAYREKIVELMAALTLKAATVQIAYGFTDKQVEYTNSLFSSVGASLKTIDAALELYERILKLYKNNI